MQKGAEAFRSIGEVANLIGVAPHVLRYWETQFSQLKPMKRADGRRYYRPADVALAAGICALLRDDGLTIRGAKKQIAVDRGEAVRARGTLRILPPLPEPEPQAEPERLPEPETPVQSDDAAPIATQPTEDFFEPAPAMAPAMALAAAQPVWLARLGDLARKLRMIGPSEMRHAGLSQALGQAHRALTRLG
ncbi:MerR family transcriptional regulator [Paracoccus sp. 1_MG-2023]|uniref:MerR family transcriptional regulator n=1 Tax=unclassified Paracoccus (in: a-proteobacteria) TaxID=2688777 RepID=UPI001C0824B6|nr:MULTISPECIES: MerR family transcriptional regulator [unclassified Paracoccus (in: a-proteobacteria)]MBU2956461.1 MerR family transcriptional regulator [Paracoccus sp. C2R09]MDO6669735.1 MerR family transcriptional regulator [Paracoccus sp. 1_MG-2023]